MTLAQNNHVIQALPPNRTNHSFSVRILPRRQACGDDLFDTKRFGLPTKTLSLDRISITDQVPRRLIHPACFKQLTRRPCGRWVFGHVEV